MRGRRKFLFPEAKPASSRFRYALNKYRVKIDNGCTNCGICVEVCPYRVYAKGSKKPRTPPSTFASVQAVKRTPSSASEGAR